MRAMVQTTDIGWLTPKQVQNWINLGGTNGAGGARPFVPRKAMSPEAYLQKVKTSAERKRALASQRGLERSRKRLEMARKAAKKPSARTRPKAKKATIGKKNEMMPKRKTRAGTKSAKRANSAKKASRAAPKTNRPKAYKAAKSGATGKLADFLNNYPRDGKGGLRDMAKKAGIRNYSRMNKATLAEQLLRVTNKKQGRTVGHIAKVVNKTAKKRVAIPNRKIPKQFHVRNLEKMRVADLKKLATKHQLPGRSRLVTKGKLVKHLSRFGRYGRMAAMVVGALSVANAYLHGNSGGAAMAKTPGRGTKRRRKAHQRSSGKVLVHLKNGTVFERRRPKR